MIGILAVLLGGWIMLYGENQNRPFIAAEARVLDIEDSCRLSPRNGKLVKIETTQKITCDRARAIAENRPEEDYRILEKRAYTLQYIDPAGMTHEKVLSSNRMYDRPPGTGDTVPIRVDVSDTTDIRVAKMREADDTRTPLYKMLILYGATLALNCSILAWLLGVCVDWSRVTWIGRRAYGALR